MSGDHMSGGSDYDAVSNWTGNTPSEANSMDTIKDLMQRFTLDCQPDLTLKLRSRVSGVILGADITHNPVTNTQRKALVVKPVSLEAPWRRLRVDDAGTVQLRSKKLQWWLLTLDMEGHVNPRTRTSSLNWRVATKWDMYRGQIRNKKRLGLVSGAEARVHYTVSYNLPEIGGNVTARGTDVEQEMSADIGYAHGDIPRVDLVIWPQLLGRKQGKLPLVEQAAAPVPAPARSALQLTPPRLPHLPQLQDLERLPAVAREAAEPLRGRASQLLAAACKQGQRACAGVMSGVHAGAARLAKATAPRHQPELE